MKTIFNMKDSLSRVKKILILISFPYIFGFTNIYADNNLPTNNPYKELYPDTYPTWTDLLNWDHVLNITDFEPDEENYWDAALNMAMNQLNNGGTIFFPSGTYRFKSNIVLTNGIILRGEKPLYTDARENNFAPPSRLVFPKYEPVFEGDGTPNSTAFKEINVTAGASNIGLVYLDINRATIRMGNDASVGVLVFGIRSNNAATPQSDIPDKSIGQYGWQRFSSVWGVNIAAYGKEKVSVVGCRVNDLTNNTIWPIEDDSYAQPGYVATGKFKGPADRPDGATRADIQNGIIEENDTTHIMNGEWAMFNYLDHYGIRVSGQKVNPKTINGTLNQEIEVINNWVLTTSRVGYFTEGIGLIVRGNVKKDIGGKRVFLHPLGKSLQANNSATYENRGINFAGENILIEDNDIQVERHNILYTPYSSVDGEGILIQWQDPWGYDTNNKSSGKETRINHVVIRNNRSNAYIGFWDLEIPQSDIHITGNDLLNKASIIFLKLENEYRIDNIHIEDNMNVNGIELQNSKGVTNGCNLYIRNNTGSGTISAGAQCIIEGNTGFTEKRGPAASELYITELFPYYDQLYVEQRDTICIRFNQPIQLSSTSDISVESDKTGMLKIKNISVQNNEMKIITDQPLIESGEKISVTLPANAVNWENYSNEFFTWSFFMKSEEESSMKSAIANNYKSNIYYNTEFQTLHIQHHNGNSGHLEIFSIDGTLIKDYHINSENSVCIPLTLNRGIYLARFISANDEIKGKFIVP